MPKSKPPRKRVTHSSLRVTRDTLRLAASRAAVTPDEVLSKLRMRELAAIDAMARGQGAPQDLCDLMALCLRTLLMARDRVGPEAIPACRLLDAHLLEAQKRLRDFGAVCVGPEAVALLREVYEFHDLQRQSVGRAEYERALLRAAQAVRVASPDVVEIAA